MKKELLKGHLPVLILGMLDQQPLHGYGLCQALAERGAAKWKLGEGTIYPLLHRLERQGHLRSSWVDGQNGKSRKVYRVTPSGRRLIAQHTRDWRQIAGMFTAVLGEEWATR
jgi:PadR family transcriptional regulator, regulatory protein PadR